MKTFYVGWTEKVCYTYRVEAESFEEATRKVIFDGEGKEVCSDSDGIVEGSIVDLSYMYEGL